jgi:transposase-like protein
MRREIRKVLRQIELSGQCPKCEIDAETIGEEIYWNGAKRRLKCPECGYEFYIEFRIKGNRLQANLIPPDITRAIDLELTDEEQEYLRHELGKLRPI